MGDLVAAGVNVEWLSSPETRIPQVFALARSLGRAHLRDVGRMAAAIGLAFSENPQREIERALREV